MFRSEVLHKQSIRGSCSILQQHHHEHIYIQYKYKSTGTPSLEEKKALPNCANKDGNIIHVLKNCISTSVASDLEVSIITI